MTQAVLFPLGREGYANAEVAWYTATIKMALCRGYTYDAADKFVADLASVTQVAVATLGTKTYALGVCDAADGTFGAVNAGAACDCLIIYQASAVGGGADVATNAQRLIAYIDNGTGLPVTPNGGEITYAFDAGAVKIFKL
jgi:hypothetical protein